MKKAIIVILAVIMALSAAACGSKNGKSGSSGAGSGKNGFVGDTITFGKYEQDNDPSNGKEDIEWIVLAKEGDKALIISKYALDCQQYHLVWGDITWETCFLREWLNGTFLNTAFSADEQNRICNSIVTADKSPGYSVFAGNNTTDKVFLLSVTEVDRYFNSVEARKCVSTDYAIAQGVQTNSKTYCFWWLRSSSDSSGRAAVVGSGGLISDHVIRTGDAAVRPAMWIKIGS